MAVTKATYTIAPTWTAVQLADAFKQAFIDAGLMTDWFDSFLSGTIENRILRVINDGSKTFGTVYYWFMFTTSGAFISTTSTWNATSHIPTGTIYRDYYATTTNVTSNHVTMLSVVNTTSATLTRYTSGVNTNVSLFLFRQGSTYRTFMLSSPGFGPLPIVDQDRMQFNYINFLSSVTAGYTSRIDFYQPFSLRNTYLGATQLTRTALGWFTAGVAFASYGGFAQGTDGTNGNFSGTAFWLPTVDNAVNTAVANDFFPVFTSPTICPYLSPLPSDFGFANYYISSTMVAQDTLIVTAGVEEWEMLHLTINNISGVQGSKLMFLARTV